MKQLLDDRYEKQSAHDYQTDSEMIDWAYGRLGIHAYTMEVYTPGEPAAEGMIPNPYLGE
jgi:hypothetical protein